MSRIIRLTENQLYNIVKRVLTEQKPEPGQGGGNNNHSSRWY